MSNTDNSMPDHQKAYIVVGIVAAAVSAAVAAYVFTNRARALSTTGESVQDLLERCHSQVRQIEQRLADLHPASTSGEPIASR